MITMLYLIVGIAFILRLIKISPVKSTHFTGMPQDIFTQWKNLMMKSIYIVLCASWGFLAISFLISKLPWLENLRNSGSELSVHFAFLLAYIVIVAVALLFEHKANKILKEFGFKWP